MLDAVRELRRNYELQQKEVARLFLISMHDNESFHLLVFLDFLCLSCNVGKQQLCLPGDAELSVLPHLFKSEGALFNSW